MKYIHLIEGVTFVALSIWLVQWQGLTGLLIAALICNIGITGSYGVIRTARYFHISFPSVVGWVARPLWILLLAAGLFTFARTPAIPSATPVFQFLVAATVFCFVIIPAIWFVGMTPNLRSELEGLLAKILRKAKSRLHMA